MTLSKGLYKDGYYVNVFCPGAIDTKIRDGLNINNPNVMAVEEGANKILHAIQSGSNGDVYFYRKDESKLLNLDSDYLIP